MFQTSRCGRCGDDQADDTPTLPAPARLSASDRFAVLQYSVGTSDAEDAPAGMRDRLSTPLGSWCEEEIVGTARLSGEGVS